MLQSAAVRPGRSVYVEAAAFFAKSYTSRTGPARHIAGPHYVAWRTCTKPGYTSRFPLHITQRRVRPLIDGWNLDLIDPSSLASQ